MTHFKRNIILVLITTLSIFGNTILITKASSGTIEKFKITYYYC